MLCRKTSISSISNWMFRNPLYQQSSSLSAEDDSNNYISNPVEFLLNTLLALQYHDIIISLHRGSIKLSSPPRKPQNISRAEPHADTALKHALASIHITHSRMSQHDVFYGYSELYQYQWNAVLTMVGFILAYPSCPQCPTALSHVDLALEVFEFGGRQSDAAARAASFTRYLRDKVNDLGISQNVNHASSDTVERVSPVDLSAEYQGLEKDTYVGRQVEEPHGLDIPPEDLDLWSWTDFIDQNVWPNLSKEGNEALVNI